MAALISMNRFIDTITGFRQRLPFHEELPKRVTEAEAEALFMELMENRGRAPHRKAGTLSLREMAVFCRMLVLPQVQAAEARLNWMPVAQALPLKTYYLQLRAQLQYNPDNLVLREEFARCAAAIRNNPSFLIRIEGLLKSTHDALARFDAGMDPVDCLLEDYRAYRTMIGVFGADQGLLRVAPLFRTFRERWFTECDVPAYLIDAREMLRALDQAKEPVRHHILAHFLQVHRMETFPEALTMELINRYGLPDDSLEWEEAELLRLEMAGQKKQVAPSSPDREMKTSPQNPETDEMSGLHALHEWYLRSQMKMHFGADSLKYEVFSQFMPYLRSISKDTERDAIQLHFMQFVVLDFKDVSHFSWVCDPAELEMRYESMVSAMLEQGGQEPGFKRKRIPEARDFVIEQDNGAAVRLTFAEVGKLYTLDLLEIRLGLKEHETWGVM